MPERDRDGAPGGHRATRIDLTRTGGFGGLTLRGTVDLDTLPAAEADELSDLLAAVDFAALDQAGTAEPRPDEFRYDVRVVSPQGTHHVLAGDSTAPPPLPRAARPSGRPHLTPLIGSDPPSTPASVNRQLSRPRDPCWIPYCRVFSAEHATRRTPGGIMSSWLLPDAPVRDHRDLPAGLR